MEIRGGLPEDVTPGLSTSLRVKVCPEDTEEGRRRHFQKRGQNAHSQRCREHVVCRGTLAGL